MRKSLARRSAQERRQDAFDVGEHIDHLAVLDERRDMRAAIRTLTRRRLVRATRESTTAVPLYTVQKPWRR